MKRDLPERLLGKDPELEGEAGKEDGGVHVAEVVGGVNGGFVYVELLRTDDFDRGEADEQEGAGPKACNGMLLATGLVPEAHHEGDAAEAAGGETD